MTKLKYLPIIFLLGSCQISRPPSVKIISPINDQLFQINDTVEVRAELSDADALMDEYLTVVTGNNYEDTIMKFEDNNYRSPYTLSKQFPLQTNDSVKIIVAAYGGSAIMVEKTVVIHSN